MKYLIISDLHIGDGSSADTFSYKDGKKLSLPGDALLDWISYVVKPEMVLFAGDIYELWKNRTKQVYAAHGPFIERLKNRSNQYIIGNHDYSLLGSNGVTLTMANGKTVRVEHGHKSDPMMTSPLSRAGVWALGMIERETGKATFEERLDSIKAHRGGTSEIERDTLEYAQKLLKKYDYCVLGHTHVHSVYEQGRYWNSGSCTHGQKQGVYIDTDACTINLVEG